MKGARGVVVALVAACIAVGGAALGARQMRRDGGALARVAGLPDPSGAAEVPGEVALAVADDARLVALARRQLPDWIDWFKPLGAGRLANVVGLTLLGGGVAHGDRRALLGGVTLLEANAVLGVAIDAAKQGFGRVRPNHPGPGRWFAGGNSFPSSHAAHAYLTATVFGEALDEPGFRAALEYLAGAVALQRLHEGVHYPTDVLAGRWLGRRVGERLCRARGLTAGTR